MLFFFFFGAEIPNPKFCCSSSKSRVRVQPVFCRTETRSCRAGAGGPLAGPQNQLLHLSPLRSLSEGQGGKVNVDRSRKRSETFRKLLDEPSPDRPVQPMQRSLLIPLRLPDPRPRPRPFHMCTNVCFQPSKLTEEQVRTSENLQVLRQEGRF